jgi:3'-5' exoribonuclease
MVARRRVSRPSGAAVRVGLGPRAFCGDVYPWPLISALSDGNDVVACFFIREKKRLETRQNKPYLRLLLGDRTGEITAFVWEDAERWDRACPPDGVIGVRGRVSAYQDRLQIKVDALEALEPAAEDLELLLPSSPRDRTTMERELDAIVKTVEDAALGALLKRCVGRGTKLGREYRVHPAAMRNHHAYLCGLMEHSLSVAGACDRLAVHYREQGYPVDRDLLVTGALLHDIGKLRELRALPANGYTDEGRLLGHIVIGIGMVAKEAEKVSALDEQRLLLLQHLIASHQGRPEWDSPKVPQMVEALILHYADDLDAKLAQARALLDGVAPGEWSVYDRSLERALYQARGPESHTVSADADPETTRSPDEDPGRDEVRGGPARDSLIDLFRD